MKSRKSTRNLRLTNCKAQVGGAQKGEQAMISPSKTKGEINMTFADNLVRLRREKGFPGTACRLDGCFPSGGEQMGGGAASVF
ncbi:MAG: hypothetical protein V8T36_00170 [Ruthenibacterium lactatiformans]